MRKALITLGIVCIVITMIIEWWLGNYAILAMIIPLIYLINIRKG